MNKATKTVNYIYDVNQPGGAEKQCRIQSAQARVKLIETGGFIRAMLTIHRSLKNASQATDHVFWLSRDQALGGIISRLVSNKNNTISYNIRNQPLKFRVSPRSYIYERIAFLNRVDKWLSNSQSTLDAFSRKYHTKPAHLIVQKNIIETGHCDWKYEQNVGISIIFVGHPNLLKGFDVLLRFLERMDKEIECVYIYGFEMHQITRVERNILKNFKTRYAGHNDHWFSEAYKNAVLLNTSRSEGYPSAPLEALGHGIPILIPRHIIYSKEIEQMYSYDDIMDVSPTTIYDLFERHNEIKSQ